VSLLRLDPEKIVVPEVRARSRMTPEQREFLRSSISRFKILSPIVVRQLPDGSYELVDGENRLREAQSAGLDYVDCICISLEDRDASLVNLLLNIARGTQDPMGEAYALKKALDSGATVPEIAKICGRSERWVKLRLVLLDLPEEFQKLLKENKLRVGHVEAAARLGEPEEIYSALTTAAALGWTVSTMENYVYNRLESMRRREAEGLGPPEPPKPLSEEAIQLATFKRCMRCDRMVHKSEIVIPRVCRGCLTLSKYLTTQLGEPEAAMRQVYEYYEAWRKAQVKPPVPIEPSVEERPAKVEQPAGVFTPGQQPIPLDLQPILDQEGRVVAWKYPPTQRERGKPQTKPSEQRRAS